MPDRDMNSAGDDVIPGAPWNGARLFITGGTGFLGKALLAALRAPAASGDIAAITVLSRDPDAFLRRHPEFAKFPELAFVRGDVLNFDFPDDLFSHVIHAATDVGAASAAPLAYYDEIVNGTRRVLDFARVCCASRFLLTSSGAVYGVQPDGVDAIDEAAPQAPSTMDAASVYGQGKRAAEHLCRLYHAQHGLDCMVARCFAFVGDYLPLDGRYAIGNFIADALDPAKPAIIVQGDGTALRSYLHTADMADWLLTILRRGEACAPYNVGSDRAISIGALAHLVRDVLAPEKEVRILGTAKPDAARSRYVPAIARARADLGLAVRIDLEAAIRATAASALRPPLPCAGEASIIDIC
jgi:UDP-glucuronate decarboxylase